ncbi:MAG: hypothetical protein MJ082_00935 [Clostridia bacterium]|nr:hypothetical protein [Clostridia bacterium]
MNFWDSEVWTSIAIPAVLLLSLLIANIIKKSIPFLRNSLIPTSVLGGIMLLLVDAIYKSFAGVRLLDTALFGYNGTNAMEIITYHCLALGFIASSFKPAKEKLTKERSVEIFNTGVTTVSTYLMQGLLGIGLTLFYAFLIDPEFFGVAGTLLPYGYGQGTGQALNYGAIYENDYGFVGGKSFGLAVAALGFLSAALGGVIYLEIIKRKYNRHRQSEDTPALSLGDVQGPDEIPMNGSIDKLTIQVGLVVCTYLLTYGVMNLLGSLIPSLRSVLFGFNFLFGVLFGTLASFLISKLRQGGVIKKEYVNPFLMKRISGFFFDVMIVAGLAAIRLEVISSYWMILLALGIIGAVSTFVYNRFVAKRLFPGYSEEQFLVMYGMLTGTASTGIVLLRELDPDFKTPASDNLVYQNFPAIVLGFPMMLLGTFAPKNPTATVIILAAAFLLMNVILFRRKLFCRKKDMQKQNQDSSK